MVNSLIRQELMDTAVESAMLVGMNINDIMKLTVRFTVDKEDQQSVEKEMGPEYLDRKLFSRRDAVENSMNRTFAKWAQHDADWFRRVPMSRTMTVQRLEKQVRRINQRIEELEKSGSPDHYDMHNYEKLLSHIYETQHKIRTQIDPQDMINKIHEGKIDIKETPSLQYLTGNQG